MKPKVWFQFRMMPEALARIEAVADIVLDGDMERLEGADVTVIGGLKTDGPFMDKVGPNLKLIARPGIGVDTVDIPAATERQIIVINTPNAPSESTAEHAVALLMAVAKRVMVGDRHLRGETADRGLMRGTELYDRVLGVAGGGAAGGGMGADIPLS
jgi:phosphoglycerate dehydrogenase-like enzyme